MFTSIAPVYELLHSYVYTTLFTLTLSDIAAGKCAPTWGGGGGRVRMLYFLSGGLNQLFQTIHGIINL